MNRDLSDASARGLQRMRQFSRNLELIKRKIPEIEKLRDKTSSAEKKELMAEELARLKRQRTIFGDKTDVVRQSLVDVGVAPGLRRRMVTEGVTEGKKRKLEIPDFKKEKETVAKKPLGKRTRAQKLLSLFDGTDGIKLTAG